MNIVTRVLDPDESAKAIAAGGPLQALSPDPDKLKQMSIAVVEVDGEIAAYWVAWYALHTEPLWIHPQWRRHAGVVKGIVQQMEQVILATGEPSAFCVVHDIDLNEVVPYAHRLGFYEAPGKLYYLLVQEPAVEPVEG